VALASPLQWRPAVTKRAALVALMCTPLAVVAGEPPAVTTSAAPPTRTLSLQVAALFGPDRESRPRGLAVGGAYRLPAILPVDLDAGMSFERLDTLQGAVSVASIVEMTAVRRTPTSVFFGIGAGPVFAQGSIRFGTRLFGGVELFHYGAIPVQVGAELLTKFCAIDPGNLCPQNEQHTWFTGRIGLRL
jgi:hypothetical protein